MNGTPDPNVRPVILAVGDEQKCRELVGRKLHKRYEADYDVVCEGSKEAGRERLQRLKASGHDVAVVLAGFRKPGTSGVDFLVRVRDFFPLAKRLLLLDTKPHKIPPAFAPETRTKPTPTRPRTPRRLRTHSVRSGL